LHPSYIQRGQWALYPFVRADLMAAAQAALGFDPPKVQTAYDSITNPSFEQVLEYIEECKKSPSTTIDIETAHRKIRAIGLSKSTTSAMSIPIRWKGMRNRWSYTELCLILYKLRELYDSPTVKIAQNAGYDFLWLYPLIGFPREPIFDTMRAHALVYPEAPHDLGFIMSTHTDMPYHKDEGRESTSDQELWDYNNKDCIGEHIVYEKLVIELKEIGMYEFFVGFTMPFFRLTVEMEREGVLVDKKAFDHRRKIVSRKAEWLERAIT
ncbi:unnamed protein product, partial [marine sediment metagenome]